MKNYENSEIQKIDLTYRKYRSFKINFFKSPHCLTCLFQDKTRFLTLNMNAASPEPTSEIQKVYAFIPKNRSFIPTIKTSIRILLEPSELRILGSRLVLSKQKCQTISRVQTDLTRTCLKSANILQFASSFPQTAQYGRSPFSRPRRREPLKATCTRSTVRAPKRRPLRG